MQLAVDLVGARPGTHEQTNLLEEATDWRQLVVTIGTDAANVRVVQSAKVQLRSSGTVGGAWVSGFIKAPACLRLFRCEAMLFGYTQVRAPMWRNGRRNGLKIRWA